MQPSAGTFADVSGRPNGIDRASPSLEKILPKLPLLIFGQCSLRDESVHLVTVNPKLFMNTQFLKSSRSKIFFPTFMLTEEGNFDTILQYPLCCVGLSHSTAHCSFFPHENDNKSLISEIHFSSQPTTELYQ